MTRSIPAQSTLLIVSDIDGTLLNERQELPLPAGELRRFIAERLCMRNRPSTLAFASSRSLAELVLLQRMLAVRGPLIAEDGALLALDGAIAAGDVGGAMGEPRMIHTRSYAVTRIGECASRLRSTLQQVVQHDQDAGTPVLADLNATQLAMRGFRKPGVVRRAIMSREASVLLDLDSLEPAERLRYVKAARNAHITIKRGGRWCTAVSGADKGASLRMLQQVMSRRTEQSLFTVAIGNEENDVRLLEQADLPLVIRNPGRGHHPALLAIPGAVPLEQLGTAGFLEMFEFISAHSEVANQ